MSMYKSLSCLPLAFVFQLSLPLALGDGEVRVHTPESKKSLKMVVPDTNDICGEPEIWRKLTDDPSVDGVQNIKWAKINKMMADHITQTTDKINLLDLEIAKLETRIADKKKAEAAQSVPVPDMTQLITDGVAPFKDENAAALKNAQDTMCGKPHLASGEVRLANRKCLPIFKAAADNYYTEKGKVNPVRLDLDEFLAECRRLLPHGKSPHDSYCPTMCQRFTGYLEGKNVAAGETAGKSSDELISDLQTKSQQLTAAKNDLSSCKTAQEFIMSFGKQVSEQKVKIDERFEDYMFAEEALADAAVKLVKLTDALNKEEALLADAAGALEKSKADTSGLEAAVNALKAEEAKLAAELAEVTVQLESTSSKLWAAREADKVVIGLRSVVASLAGMMRMYFEEVVLKPLDSIGLGPETDMSKYVKPNIAELSTGKKLNSVLRELEGFCKGAAAESFAKVEKSVNLTTMCQFEPADTVYEELKGAVLKVRDSIKNDAEQLQTWFNPLKGQSEMTTARVEEFVKLGEPKNLREIIGVFSRTTIFKKYLKEWQLKGDFIRLIAQLRGVVTSLDKSFQDLSAQVDKLGEQLPATAAKRAETEKALADAVAKKQLDEETVQELGKTVNEMKGNFESLTDDNRLLQEEVDKALAKWEESKEQLLKVHAEATSLLESFSDEDSSELLDNAAVTAAKQELEMAKAALRDAEFSLDGVRGQLQSLTQ